MDVATHEPLAERWAGAETYAGEIHAILSSLDRLAASKRSDGGGVGDRTAIGSASAKAVRRRVSALSRPYHPDWLLLRELNRDVRWAVESYGFGALLDIGCGGRPYEMWRPPSVTRWIGLDRPDNGRADVHGTAEAIPLPPQSVQTVLCTQVLEHLADPARALEEMHRVLCSGGTLIVSAPQYWPLHEEPCDFYRYTDPGFRHLLTSAGFEIVDLRTQGRGVIVAGQALNNSILCLGDTWSVRNWLLFKASKAPLYLIVNLVTVGVALALRSERDVINRLVVAIKND